MWCCFFIFLFVFVSICRFKIYFSVFLLVCDSDDDDECHADDTPKTKINLFNFGRNKWLYIARDSRRWLSRRKHDHLWHNQRYCVTVVASCSPTEKVTWFKLVNFLLINVIPTNGMPLDRFLLVGNALRFRCHRGALCIFVFAVAMAARRW